MITVLTIILLIIFWPVIRFVLRLVWGSIKFCFVFARCIVILGLIALVVFGLC